MDGLEFFLLCRAKLAMVCHMYRFCVNITKGRQERNGKILFLLCEADIIKLPKKGDLTECRNWRRIALLNIIGKILATIVYNRLNEELESKMRPEQAGFR